MFKTITLLHLAVLVLGLLTASPAQAKTLDEEIADMKKIYGAVDEIHKPQEIEIPVGNRTITLKRVQMITFEREGDFMGISGKAVLFCQDGRPLGVSMRFREKVTQDVFNRRVKEFGTLMKSDDDSKIAQGARRVVPGVDTANMFRIDNLNSVAYLYKGFTMFFMSMPEMEMAKARN